MNVDLKVKTAEDYFEALNREINYDNESNDEEVELIRKIISCEVAYYVMRRSIVDGSLCDCIWSIRRQYISHYNSLYEEFVDFNIDCDF